MKTKNPLVVVGTVALDTVKTPSGSVKRALGGSAVHFSAAARFFCKPCIVGIVGRDFPQTHHNQLKKLKIDTHGIKTESGKSFHWQGYYEEDLNRAITVKTELNVLTQFQPHLTNSLQNTPHLFLANIDPTLQLSVLKQVKKPHWVACDTMNFWIASAKPQLIKVLKRVDIVFMNDAEAKELSGETHPLNAAQWIKKLGPSLVIIKRGEYGAFCIADGWHCAIPAYLLDSVTDPTGAGDSFAGGCLGYLSQFKKVNEAHVRQALIYGTILASFNVQSFSINRLARLQPSQIRKRILEFKRALTC